MNMKATSEVARCFSCASPDHISSQCPKGRLCMNCESPSHLAQDCPYPDRGRDIRTCFNCGGKGHVAKNCCGTPNSRSPAQPTSSSTSSTPVAHSGQQLPNHPHMVGFAQTSFHHPHAHHHLHSTTHHQQHHDHQQSGFQRQHPYPSAWQQGPTASMRANTKFRSASVNSSSSYESFYSSFGNHNDIDSELPSFESPSFSSPGNHGLNRMTPPVKREQPSPFQPIYNGFGSGFNYSEKGANNPSGHNTVVPNSDHHIHHDSSGSNIYIEDVENKFEPVHPASFGFHTPLSRSMNSGMSDDGRGYKSDMHHFFHENGASSASASGLTRESILASQRPSSQPLPLIPSTPAPSVGACPDSDDKDKKKKRKKKKKKKVGEGDDAERDSESQEAMRCFNCDGFGHLSRDCVQPRACFLCGETSHVAKQCKYSALAKEAINEETESLDGDDTTPSNPSPVPTEPEQPESNNTSLEPSSVADSAEKKKNVCLNCSEAGHRLKNCPYGRKCFQCGHVGHVARECPHISEAIKMMQKRRMEENPSPESVISDSFVGGGSSGLPSRMSTASTSSTMFSSMQGGYFSNPLPSNGSGGSFSGAVMSSSNQTSASSSVASNPSSTPPVMPGRYGAVSPFMMGHSSSSSVCSPSPTMARPNSCSPPLVFGNGAFSSFSGVDLGSDSHHGSDNSLRQDDLDPTQEVDDPNLQDLVSNLLIDLDMNEK